MINIILPITENVEGFSEFIENNLGKDIRFFVGIKENLKNKFSIKNKNVELHVYDSKANREEIINALHSCEMQKGKLLILRRPLNSEEFSMLTKSNKDIATLKAHRNNFISSIKRLAQNVVKKFFAFSYFEDISAICYGESMFELLSTCENLSMASRINKYVGLEIEEFETPIKPVKKLYNKTKNILNLMLGILFLLGSIVGGVLVCVYTKLQALTVLLVIFWIVVALMVQMVSVVNFTRTLAVGNLRYGRAEEKTI